MVLHPPQTGSYLFHITSNFQKEFIWSQKRGCRQCSRATWMEGCYLCVFETFLPQSFYLSPSNPFRDLCLCLSVQQMQCFNWNNRRSLQGMEFILTIRNVCFSLPHFAKKSNYGFMQNNTQLSMGLLHSDSLLERQLKQMECKMLVGKASLDQKCAHCLLIQPI